MFTFSLWLQHTQGVNVNCCGAVALPGWAAWVPNAPPKSVLLLWATALVLRPSGVSSWLYGVSTLWAHWGLCFLWAYCHACIHSHFAFQSLMPCILCSLLFCYICSVEFSLQNILVIHLNGVLGIACGYLSQSPKCLKIHSLSMKFSDLVKVHLTCYLNVFLPYHWCRNIFTLFRVFELLSDWFHIFVFWTIVVSLAITPSSVGSVLFLIFVVDLWAP